MMFQNVLVTDENSQHRCEQSAVGDIDGDYAESRKSLSVLKISKVLVAIYSLEGFVRLCRPAYFPLVQVK